MNQILATHNNANNSKKPIDTNKIIVFFSVAIIIFGIIIISVAGYNLYKSNEERKSILAQGNPEISIEQIEDSVKISAKYEQGISSIIYTWNEDDVHEEILNGTTTFEKLIDLVENEGESVLKVEVIGINGRKNEISQTFIMDTPGTQEDEEKPIIQWIINYNENKINAFASDETELKYIKYQWDNGEEIIVEPEEETNKLETSIDIERGQHKLVITAEDTDGNIATKSGTFKGVKKPEINAIKYGDIVEITVSHDMGFKKIEFIINDLKYVYDANYAGYNSQITSLLYKMQLVEGENVIQVTAESLEQINIETEEGTTEVYKGRCEYIPDENTNE